MIYTQRSNESLYNVIALAAICVGIAGIQGGIMNPALGWIAFGIGSGVLLLTLYDKGKTNRDDYHGIEYHWKQIAFHSITFLALAVIGILGVQGILSYKAVSYALIASILVRHLVPDALVGVAVTVVRPCCFFKMLAQKPKYSDHQALSEPRPLPSI